jgi:HD-like signal output (HDOD) protein
LTGWRKKFPKAGGGLADVKTEMSSPPANENKNCCDNPTSGKEGFLCQSAAPVTTATQKSPPALPATKTRILFVDDEPSMLRVLKMGMRPMLSEWDMEFAESGEQALGFITAQPFDVVVTDMRMTGMNGAQLLNHVMRLHPQTIRIVLSGYADLSEVVSCVGLTHQFLTKPCSLDDLRTCLKRVSSIKHQLGHEKLRQLTAGMSNLPSLPKLYLEIVDALHSPAASTELIAEIASKDPALSAKMLQLSNSAFFGFSRRVFSVAEAVQLLGAGVIQSLALAVPLFSQFDEKKCPGFLVEHVWDHSAETGALARRIYNDHLDDSHRAEQAFAAGVMHDIGKLILAEKISDQYSEILKEAHAKKSPLHHVERQHLGASHAEVGAYLLALWGLPVPLIEAVACHHHPRRCANPNLCLAGVVHIADALQHAGQRQPDAIPSPVDVDYLKYIGMEADFEIWRQQQLQKIRESV